jgi:hypothetical protein
VLYSDEAIASMISVCNYREAVLCPMERLGSRTLGKGD